MVRPGQSLLTEVNRRAATALEGGALVPIATEHEVVEDAGIPFVIHILRGAEHKAITTAGQRATGANPFLPPDPELLVAKVSESHLCVLNKFNVLHLHLLIITRHFEHQRELLTVADFEALAATMHEIGGLGFYNAGKVAGASQPHKHLQLVVRLPGERTTPMDTVLTNDESWPHPGRCPALPFNHAVARLDGSPLAADRGAELHGTYRELLELVEIGDSGAPYNMLLTTHWMMVVPRAVEHFSGISVNALGFAGSLLVPDRQRLHELRQVGPMAVLEAVAGTPAD